MLDLTWWQYVIIYATIGALLVFLFNFLDPPKEGEDDSDFALALFFVWPLMLGAALLFSLALIPLGFYQLAIRARKRIERSVEGDDQRG